jgi:flagellar hook protein FlgE
VTQTLNSGASIGDTATSPVKVYDSQGKSYEATVTYTKTGTNQWSYSVTMPDTLNSTPATAATVTDTVTPTSTVSGANTISKFNFDSSSGTLPTGATSGTLATVDGGTTLSIGGTSVTIPAAGESVSALAGQINGLGITGVSASVSGGVLSVTSPTATTVTSSVKQDVAGATVSYDFGSSGSTLSTVNTGTNLTLTGLTATGASATITAPTVTSGESVATYATALTSALSNAGIVGVTVNNAGGKLSITGANLSTSGSVIQDPVASSATTGTLSFDSNGNLTSPATNVSGLTFSGLSDGAATLDLNWNLFGTTGTSAVTQTASTSTTGSATQNGYASGQYNGLSVNSSGVVTASFSNNQNEIVGQLALATVSNQEGLQAEGSTNYATTTASGNAAIGVAGAGGRGTLEDSTLEGSNVDISSEFSSLIVAQRAFEANSKAVTTFDTVTQEAIGMIH